MNNRSDTENGPAQSADSVDSQQVEEGFSTRHESMNDSWKWMSLAKARQILVRGSREVLSQTSDQRGGEDVSQDHGAVLCHGFCRFRKAARKDFGGEVERAQGVHS